MDMVVDCIEDTVKNIFLIFFEANEEKKVIVYFLAKLMNFIIVPYLILK